MGFGSAWILIEKWKCSITFMTLDKLDGKYGKGRILVGQKRSLSRVILALRGLGWGFGYSIWGQR
jgi:hypothetical protein